jgi:hypothetical protein
MAILSSIWDKLKSAIGDGKKTTSQDVHNIVSGSVQEHMSPATKEEAEQSGQQTDQQPANDKQATIRYAKLLRLAMEDFKRITLNKYAVSGGLFSIFSNKKAATGNILTRVLSLFFRVALASAGLMVAGDAINLMLGRPNAFNNTVQNGHPVAKPAENGSGEPWTVSTQNTPEGINNMLIQFVKDTYPGVIDGQESVVQNLPAFQAVSENIAWYNHGSAGGPVVFLPKMFISKKQLVDHFMGDFHKPTA